MAHRAEGPNSSGMAGWTDLIIGLEKINKISILSRDNKIKIRTAKMFEIAKPSPIPDVLIPDPDPSLIHISNLAFCSKATNYI